MTEVQALYLILALVYLSECIEWSSRGAVALRGRAGHPGRLREGIPLPALGRARPILGPLLPWQGELFFCQLPPLSLSSAGWCAATPFGLDDDARHEGRAPGGAWEGPGRWRADGPRLKRAGSPVARLASSAIAADVAARLGRLEGLPARDRERAIRKDLAASLDEGAARERLERFSREARLTRIACPALFLFLFGAAPLVLWQAGAASSWPWLLAALLSLMIFCAAAYARAHRRLYPAQAADRRSALALILLAPTAGIRARQVLARDLLAGSHPLAAAAALGRGASLRAFAGRIYRDLRFPARPGPALPEGADPAIVSGFAEMLRAETERALRRLGLELDALLRPEPGDAPAGEARCPRCREPYRPEVRLCADCGLELDPLPSPPADQVGSQRSPIPS